MTDRHMSANTLTALFFVSELIIERTMAINVISMEPKATVPRWYLKATLALVIMGLSKWALFLERKDKESLLLMKENQFFYDFQGFKRQL